MTPITDNESAIRAKYALELALLKSPSWQLWAYEQRLTKLTETQGFEFSIEWGKLIFAWWNDEAAQSWRVTAYQIQSDEIQLRVTRSFGRDLMTLSLRVPVSPETFPPSPSYIDLAASRQAYSQLLLRLLNQHFAASRSRLLPAHSRALPGAAHYLRARVQQGSAVLLAIGVHDAESQEVIDGIVTTGLLWLANTVHSRKRGPTIQRLCFCLPSQRAQTALERLSLLTAAPFGAKVECLEIDLQGERLIPRTLATQLELINTHTQELHWPEADISSQRWHNRIRQLAPEDIEVRAHPHLPVDSFSIHGLEFARAQRHGLERVTFGVAGVPAEFAYPFQAGLSEGNFAQLADLVREIQKYRCAVAPDRQHPFYRLRAEAWLESLLRRNLRALDAQLDDRFVYSQIPAWRADERSVLDLLTINHLGRLVVIEIKASEDIHLPFQGLDYWVRVEQARVRGEFELRHLFPGVSLAQQTPLLYLVAPRLRFHRSVATLTRCLSPDIEVHRFGLNTNWRAGIRVHTRERMNGSAAV